MADGFEHTETNYVSFVVLSSNQIRFRPGSIILRRTYLFYSIELQRVKMEAYFCNQSWLQIQLGKFLFGVLLICDPPEAGRFSVW